MNTPEGRQTFTEPVGPTPRTRGAHAVYSLHVRRLMSSEHLTHSWRTLIAHRAPTRRVSNACPALHARTIRSARLQHAVHSLGYLTCAISMRSACALCACSALAARCTFAQRRTGLIFHVHFMFNARTVRRVCAIVPLRKKGCTRSRNSPLSEK